MDETKKLPVPERMASSETINLQTADWQAFLEGTDPSSMLFLRSAIEVYYLIAHCTFVGKLGALAKPSLNLKLVCHMLLKKLCDGQCVWCS